MRVILCLFDSLNRLALGCYGGTSVRTPNFDRFSERAITFDTHYVGSLPCMPARRDMHTGRLNFMHRSWGPLEPFDNSFPELLSEQGIYSHLISDHLHYFEDGGSTYHTRYSSWDFIRGQEYDPWKAMVQPPIERFKEMYSEKNYTFERGRGSRLQHMINRDFMRDEADFPGPQCFTAGFEFIKRNHTADDWFLQIECFDPHEPFFAPERFRQQYKTGYNGPILDWPFYEKVQNSPQEIAEIRANYAALVAMCDDYFGQLLDQFDHYNLWHDTALILTTDHGFLLAEHDWWGKNRMPYFEEISHIPLLVYHPDAKAYAGDRRSTLTQTTDIMPTVLDCFNLPLPIEVCGHSLLQNLNQEQALRDTAIFGMFGGPIGATDGHYAYYLYPKDLMAPGLHEYTLMPMHLNTLFTPKELQTATLATPFDFTKGVPTLRIDAMQDARRIPIHDGQAFGDTGTKLYDLVQDPNQQQPIQNEAVENQLRAGMKAVLQAHDSPQELYTRYGLV